MDVLPNGTLVVSGEKQNNNRRSRPCASSGVVNPLNLVNGNTVSSTQVADAHRIARPGPGRRAQVMGWLARFFPHPSAVLDIPNDFTRESSSCNPVGNKLLSATPSRRPCRNARGAGTRRAHQGHGLVQGVRPNQLIGYGLVGVSTAPATRPRRRPFTVQSIACHGPDGRICLGTSLQPEERRRRHGDRPRFASRNRATARRDRSSMGNAGKALRGGTLPLTPLVLGADGQIHAMSQGNPVVAGAGASAGGLGDHQSSQRGSRFQAARPSSAPWRAPFLSGDGCCVLNCMRWIFGTAGRVADAINRRMAMVSRRPLDDA